MLYGPELNWSAIRVLPSRTSIYKLPTPTEQTRQNFRWLPPTPPSPPSSFTSLFTTDEWQPPSQTHFMPRRRVRCHISNGEGFMGGGFQRRFSPLMPWGTLCPILLTHSYPKVYPLIWTECLDWCNRLLWLTVTQFSRGEAPFLRLASELRQLLTRATCDSNSS